MTPVSKPPVIGILSALPEELAAVAKGMSVHSVARHGGREFRTGEVGRHRVITVVAGIGKVAAATTATLLIERFAVNAVLFTGVAGGLHSSVKVGDVVIASEFLQHDMDASPLFPPHEVPGYARARFPTDATWQSRLTQAARDVLANLDTHVESASIKAFHLEHAQVHSGLIISGDQFVSTAASSNGLSARLPDALATEMEGAAVAQVCHDFDVPFAAVRTISDRADDEAHVDFMRFVTEVASHYSAATILACLQNS